MSMNKTIDTVLFVIVIILIFNVLCSINCKRVKRVIGGVEVPCGSQIRVASLRNTWSQHLCGATVLSPDFAVTAAHCVEHTPDSYRLQLNNYCIKHDETPPRADVLEVIPHPLYDKLSNAHDIAVLRLQFDLDITWPNGTLFPGSSFGISGTCQIFGYGYKNTETKELSEKLVVADVKIISLDDCTRLLGEYMAPSSDNGMICAVGDGVDSCQGDSGGPLICGGYLQGVCGYGLSCGIPEVPGVYTSIGPHLKWLRNTIDNTGN